jgi:hypothetical protein
MVVSNHEQLNRAFVPRAQDRNVRRPREALLYVGRKLHFHAHAQHGLVVDQQHDCVCAELSRDHFRQIRRLLVLRPPGYTALPTARR